MATETRQQMATQIDGGLNFVLWLLGRRYNADVVTREYASCDRHHGKNAPLPELWAYLRRETSEGRNLRLDKYRPGFVSWARRHLRQEPHGVLSTGGSLAKAIAEPIRKKMSASIAKRRATRSSAADRSSKTVSKRLGQQVTAQPSWNAKATFLDHGSRLGRNGELEKHEINPPEFSKGQCSMFIRKLVNDSLIDYRS